MADKRKFSLSAIFLILLLSIRLLGQIYMIVFLVLLPLNLLSTISLGVIVLLAIFYVLALVGVIKKTEWGLKFVIAIAIIDVISTGALDLVNGTLGSPSSIGAIIVDLILLVLASNISRRIKR